MQVPLVKYLLLNPVLLLLIGCGAYYPFQRGERIGDEPVMYDGNNRPVPPEKLFTNNVKPHIERSCRICHPTRVDYSEAIKWIKPGEPEQSLLYTKAVGLTSHAAGKLWDQNSPQAQAMREWILAEGTPPDTTQPTPTPTPTPNPEPTLDRQYFEKNILPALNNNIFDNDRVGCIGCHRDKGPKVWDFDIASGLVVFKNPQASILFQLAEGTANLRHPYKFLDSKGDPDAQKKLNQLRNWILGNTTSPDT